MNRYTAAAFADIAGLEYTAPATTLLIALLVFVGLRSRMREYSV
jgi:hypothetical protein